MSGKMVEAFVNGNENDAAGARVIWLAQQHRDGRKSKAAGDQQAPRHLSAHAVGSRRQGGAGACQGAQPVVAGHRKRRPPNVVMVALANKMARTIWAVLAHDCAYSERHISVRPGAVTPV